MLSRESGDLIRAGASLTILTILFGITAFIGVMMLVAPDAKPGVRVTGAVVAAIFGFMTVRSRLVGVLVQDSDLVIRHWFRSRWIPWQQITKFRTAPGLSASPTHTLYVDLQDGTNIRVQELSANALIHRGRSPVHEAVDLLEKERSRRMGGCDAESN